MSRRTRIAGLGAALVVIVILISAWISTRDDPVYGGRRLSSWFLQYAIQDSSHHWDGPIRLEEQEALRAMRALGTNALPWLVRQAFATQPGGWFGSNRVVWAYSSQPITFFGRKAPRLKLPRLVSRLQLCEDAVEVVGKLGVPADSLLHLLQDRLQGPHDVYWAVSIHMLGGAREDAEKVLPHILSALQSTNDGPNSAAIHALEQIGPMGKTAIPTLVDRLRSEGFAWYFKTWEIALLGNFGQSAIAAVPELERFMHSDANPKIRATAAMALCQITGDHSDALALVRGALLGADASNLTTAKVSRDDVNAALARARTLPDGFVPILAQLAEEARTQFTESWMQWDGMGTLERLAPEAAAPILNAWMRNDPREFVRASAAQHLLQLQRTNQQAVFTLCQMIATNLRNRSFLLSFLGEASSKSGLAVKTLEGFAATNSHPVMREVAREALRRIHRREAARGEVEAR